MKKSLQRWITIIITISAALFVIGCSSKSANLSATSLTYKRAFKDGCATAQGNYTKHHEAFKTDIDYYEGWFAGRQYCQYHKVTIESL